MAQMKINQNLISKRIESRRRISKILGIKFKEDIRPRHMATSGYKSPLQRLHPQLSMMFYNNYHDAMQMTDEELVNALRVYLRESKERRTSARIRTGRPSKQARFRPCCSKYPGIFPFCDPRC